MRLTELLGAVAVDARGERVGAVRDVRLRRDPATGEMSVAGLVVGDGRFAAIAHGWGFVEGRACGPWPLRALARDARRAARYVDAADVAGWGRETVELRAGAVATPLEQGRGT